MLADITTKTNSSERLSPFFLLMIVRVCGLN